MSNFEEKIFERNGFRLEVYPLLREPEPEVFDSGDPAAAIQCGADFHLSYQGKYSHNPTLGILQFVRSKKQLGNQPYDRMTDICLDKKSNEGNWLINYLFGNPGTNISYENTRFNGKPTTVRGINRCEIYDTPREMYGITDQRLTDSPVRIEFWDFIVGIDGSYCLINPIGIKWDMVFTQKGITNDYTCDIDFCEADLEQMRYKDIFHSAIAAGTYSITKALRK